MTQGANLLASVVGIWVTVSQVLIGTIPDTTPLDFSQQKLDQTGRSFGIKNSSAVWKIHFGAPLIGLQYRLGLPMADYKPQRHSGHLIGRRVPSSLSKSIEETKAVASEISRSDPFRLLLRKSPSASRMLQSSDLPTVTAVARQPLFIFRFHNFGGLRLYQKSTVVDLRAAFPWTQSASRQISLKGDQRPVNQVTVLLPVEATRGEVRVTSGCLFPIVGVAYSSPGLNSQGEVISRSDLSGWLYVSDESFGMTAREVGVPGLPSPSENQWSRTFPQWTKDRRASVADTDLQTQTLSFTNLDRQFTILQIYCPLISFPEMGWSVNVTGVVASVQPSAEKSEAEDSDDSSSSKVGLIVGLAAGGGGLLLLIAGTILLVIYCRKAKRRETPQVVSVPPSEFYSTQTGEGTDLAGQEEGLFKKGLGAVSDLQSWETTNIDRTNVGKIIIRPSEDLNLTHERLPDNPVPVHYPQVAHTNNFRGFTNNNLR